MQPYWLFAELSPDELEKVLSIAQRQRVEAGQVLFRKEDPTPGLHLIEAGAVKIYTLTPEGRERIIDVLGPGDICGEMGVIDRAPAAAWGEALIPTDLRVISAGAFQQVLLAHPTICLKVCQVLVAKLRSSGRQLDETLFLGARERVLRHLLRLVERHGAPGEGGLHVPVRLTHQELALWIGTSRETVSRVLAELKERGLLLARHRRMVAPDLAALQSYIAAAAEGF